MRSAFAQALTLLAEAARAGFRVLSHRATTQWNGRILQWTKINIRISATPKTQSTNVFRSALIKSG
jgi:hypothetical protein